MSSISTRETAAGILTKIGTHLLYGHLAEIPNCEAACLWQQRTPPN